jgi:mono/diheme cytochrome c family protein
MRKMVLFTATLVIALLAFLLTGSASPGAAVNTADSGGLQAFEDQKCHLCHGVAAVNIEAKTKSAKLKGPDLSGYSKDAAWTSDYLYKKVDLDGKKHPNSFKGSEEELQLILEWLASLE